MSETRTIICRLENCRLIVVNDDLDAMTPEQIAELQIKVDNAVLSMESIGLGGAADALHQAMTVHTAHYKPVNFDKLARLFSKGDGSGVDRNPVVHKPNPIDTFIRKFRSTYGKEEETRRRESKSHPKSVQRRPWRR
jgi:hypothetical protein